MLSGLNHVVQLIFKRKSLGVKILLKAFKVILGLVMPGKLQREGEREREGENLRKLYNASLVAQNRERQSPHFLKESGNVEWRKEMANGNKTNLYL